jgi:hypothetical protein
MRLLLISAALAIAMGGALTAEALFKPGLKSSFKQAAIFSVALLALIEISSPLRAMETAPTPPSGPAAQAILRWFTTDRSLGCANQQENDPCTVKDNWPKFEVYYGDSTGGGPRADVLAFVYYGPLPGGNMMRVNLAYFHRDGGDYRFIKTFPDVAGWGSVKGTTVRFLPGKARFTRAVKQADDPRCCATGRANYTVTLNPALLTLPSAATRKAQPTKFTPKAGLPYIPADMTAAEKKHACELVNDDPAFLRRCITNKDCEFVVQFIAAQEKRRQNATAVVFTMEQNVNGLFEDYPFLKKDFPVGNVRTARNQSAAGPGEINLLFVGSCNTSQGCFLRVYVDDGAGYKKAVYVDNSSGSTFVIPEDKLPSAGVNVSRADGEVSLFFDHTGGQLGGAFHSEEYTLNGNDTFEVTELHEGC